MTHDLGRGRGGKNEIKKEKEGAVGIEKKKGLPGVGKRVETKKKRKTALPCREKVSKKKCREKKEGGTSWRGKGGGY